MDKRAFTPGPWEYDNKGGSLWSEGVCFSASLGDIGSDVHIEWLSIVAPNGGEIVQVSGPADDSIIDQDSDDYLQWPATDDQAIANAHLISAAPDLYEALKALCDCDATYYGPEIRINCGNHGDAIEKMRVARRALTKAEGRQP